MIPGVHCWRHGLATDCRRRCLAAPLVSATPLFVTSYSRRQAGDRLATRPPLYKRGLVDRKRSVTMPWHPLDEDDGNPEPDWGQRHEGPRPVPDTVVTLRVTEPQPAAPLPEPKPDPDPGTAGPDFDALYAVWASTTRSGMSETQTPRGLRWCPASPDRRRCAVRRPVPACAPRPTRTRATRSWTRQGGSSGGRAHPWATIAATLTRLNSWPTHETRASCV